MISIHENDDPRFIAMLGTLLDSAVAQYLPVEIYLIRIDQWFDAKWLKFSGKALGAVGVWHKPATIPPFHPHRVIEESHFVAAPDSSAFVAASAPLLHIGQSSGDNLTRSIARISPAAVFLWYSAATRELDRGSVMLYRTQDAEVLSWYAAFHRFPDWRIDRHRGISASELKQMLQGPLPTKPVKISAAGVA